jgi:hypothetical protein
MASRKLREPSEVRIGDRKLDQLLHPRANLSAADLSKVNLKGVDLRKADLKWVDFRGADLQGADLRGAHLEGAYLQEALLNGANLYGAYMRRAHLAGARLEGAHLSGAHLEDTSLEEAYPPGGEYEDDGERDTGAARVLLHDFASLEISVPANISAGELGALLTALNRLHKNLTALPLEIQLVSIGTAPGQYEDEPQMENLL